MKNVIVLGAGIVGVATALALQARGRQVVLVDRGSPGRETSFGNAGIIQAEAAEPYAMPRRARDLVRIALRRGNDVNWHISALPGHLRPLSRYYGFSHPTRHQALAKIYRRLTARATADHAPLIAAADAQALIRREGFLQAYREAAELESAAAEAARWQRDYAVESDVLDSAALSKAEPNLLQPMAGAVHWTQPWTCLDPGGLVASYARLFIARGGEFATGDALDLQKAGQGYCLLAASSAERIEAAEAVIALGPWSAILARRFGLNVPMFAKRGYHCHYGNHAGPSRTFVDVANGACLAPMQAGLRITTGAEIATDNAAPDRRQLDYATRAARELFAFGEPVEPTPWHGNRPCMPDMLPVVGPVPGVPGLWAHFGHGHQGFTLGPTTAALLADEMTGMPAAVPELAPIGRGF